MTTHMNQSHSRGSSAGQDCSSLVISVGQNDRHQGKHEPGDDQAKLSTKAICHGVHREHPDRLEPVTD